MDQAALQWVSLEQSSGAPCRTAWGAREAAKSACMVRSLADENRWLCNMPTLRVSGTCIGCHCWLLLRIQQCTAGLSGTMTPWNVLNSSAVAPFNEPCNTHVTLTEVKMVWLASCDEVISLATWVRCLSVSHHTLWLNALCMFAGFSCMVSFLLSFATAAAYNQAELEHLVRCAYFPLWNLGFCTPFLICDGWMDGLHLVCKSSWTPIPSAPPCWGLLGTPDHRDITTEDGRLLSV